MEFFNFKNYSLWMNFMIFAVSAGAVWLAGARISRYADAIARMTGIDGQRRPHRPVYSGPPMLTQVGPPSLFAAVLGIVSSTIYLFGLIERRNRTIARMGYNLYLTFAKSKSGSYLANVKVAIENEKNEIVLDVPSAGPLLYAKLADGKYKVTAEVNGQSQTKTATIQPGHPRGLVYYFPKK